MNLNVAVACDEAHERADGKLDLIGVFNELHAQGFPAMQEQMTVVFVMEWEDETGDVPIHAELRDEQGQPVLAIDGQTDVTPRGDASAPAQTRLILPLERVVFPHAGRYTFHITAGQTSARALELHVVHRPA